MTENVVELPPQEAPEEEPDSHSLLRIWSEVLSHVEDAAAEPVSMGIAGKIVAGWPKISFQETPRYHEIYHEILIGFREELERVIAEHPGAIDFMEADDLKENYALYKELVINWNIQLDRLELDWDAENKDSHIEFAAIVDARGFLFARTGFAGHLEARGFQLQSDEIVDAIAASRGEK